MMLLPAIPFAIPLLVATALTAVGQFVHRRLRDAVAIGAALAALAADLVLFELSRAAPVVYWLGGWRPRGGVAVGIGLFIDPFAAGLAALAAGLITAALVFSWKYFDEPRHLYSALTLVLLAAMHGACFTADLFNLFVFYALMTVAACALTATRSEARGPLQGALNLAVARGLGAVLLLHGVALLYARAGALSFAEVGARLAGQPPDAVVLVALSLIAAGLLLGAAVVPFHFWLPDAHAVAPTPICIVFSGAMVQIGLLALARVIAVIFAAPLADRAPALSGLLLGAGALTAITGAALCFWQRDIKRLLAFSTVSHVGVALMGIATLDAAGIGGAALYVLGHGLIKGALFLCAGVIVNRLGQVDECALQGRGRPLRITGVLMALGGLCLAGLPPVGLFPGGALIAAGWARHGHHAPALVLAAAGALTGGAVLRAAGRIFLGWGAPAPEDEPSREASEDEHAENEAHTPLGRTPAVMIGPAIGLSVAGVGLGLWPGLSDAAQAHAALFLDPRAYAAIMLHGAPPPPLPGPVIAGPALLSIVLALSATAAALALALAALRRPNGLPLAERLMAPLRRIHSGHPGDQATWLVVGAAALGALVVALLG